MASEPVQTDDLASDRVPARELGGLNHAADHRLVLRVGQRKFDGRHRNRDRGGVAQGEAQPVVVAADAAE